MISKRCCILLVEDEPNDVFLIQRAFNRSGSPYQLEICSDGEQAMNYLAGAAEFSNRETFPFPDLVLLDLKLPRRSGLEVLEWLRSQPGPEKRLPIVLLTSSRQLEDINRAYELGANSYLVKPVGFDSLLDMVKHVNSYWLEMNVRPDLSN